MSTRRHGMMRPGGATRLIALLLAAGLVAGLTSSALLQAGVPGWVVLLLVVLVLAVPVVAAARDHRRSASGRR